MPLGGFGCGGNEELLYVVSVSDAAPSLDLDGCLGGTSRYVGKPPGIEGSISLSLIETGSMMLSIDGDVWCWLFVVFWLDLVDVVDVQ